jgi:bifunctional N-acetylglucosamine-1-phosphate-uridyltransferase/glucosamine-1-phosphate-acetyltransferase GlmU-like protein
MSAGSLPSLAVLLPGEGAAFRSRTPKLLHPLLGRPLAYWAAAPWGALGVAVVVLAPAGEALALAAGLPELEVAAQLAPSQLAGDLLLVRADAPLVSPETLQPLLSAGPGSVLTAGDGIATAAWLPAGALSELAGGPLTLEAVLAPLTGLQVLILDETEIGLRVEDRLGLATAAMSLRQRILEQHMRAGVTIEDPISTWVEPGVRIGADTVLRAQTRLCGATRLGDECEIGPSVSLTDSVLGDRVRVQYAVVTDSEVGDDTRIGPFAQLRPGCRLGRKVKVGNFVELKNSVVEDGASIGHLAYVGDADVGERVNVGAGVITCNYDGRRKHRTVIGRRAFLGSHTTLVAPVAVGAGAFTAAGTVVTEDVPADALAIGRSRQAVKPDWAKRKREEP